jgi:hypothetical protein
MTDSKTAHDMDKDDDNLLVSACNDVLVMPGAQQSTATAVLPQQECQIAYLPLPLCNRNSLESENASQR